MPLTLLCIQHQQINICSLRGIPIVDLFLYQACLLLLPNCDIALAHEDIARRCCLTFIILTTILSPHAFSAILEGQCAPQGLCFPYHTAWYLSELVLFPERAVDSMLTELQFFSFVVVFQFQFFFVVVVVVVLQFLVKFFISFVVAVDKVDRVQLTDKTELLQTEHCLHLSQPMFCKTCVLFVFSVHSYHVTNHPRHRRSPFPLLHLLSSPFRVCYYIYKKLSYSPNNNLSTPTPTHRRTARPLHQCSSTRASPTTGKSASSSATTAPSCYPSGTPASAT